MKLNYVCLALAAFASAANALPTHVPTANTKTPGFVAPNIISPEWDLRLQATGSMKLDGATATTQYYGYINNGSTSVMVPVLGNTTAPTLPIAEAAKSEPDKNTYLVLSGQTGADTSYNYGTRFLFQGHEVGDHGYITRINLDADGAHRVTLMADTLSDGSTIPNIDGSTWNPFTQKLMFTGEEAATSGVLAGVVLQASATYPSTVVKMDTIFGIAGWEGIQLDSDGNVWLVADQGGANGTATGGPGGTSNAKARQPNSFIYRFVPKNKNDLSQGGRLQALQVMNKANTAAITFHAGQADADINSQDVIDLHTYKNIFKTNWITIHDTATDGFAQFDANALAKSNSATPFKRPENGVFRPLTGAPFTQFFFTETGDTNNLSTAAGNFGAVFQLIQSKGPSANTGILKMFYKGDQAHAGFDNIQFFNSNKLLVVEDAGDTLHTQRNALDSGYMFDLATDYSTGAAPVRFLAEGRDASATLDSATANLQQNGDNEITGIHVSNGDASIAGLIGGVQQTPFSNGWRVFFTQQHGDNNTFEIVPKR